MVDFLAIQLKMILIEFPNFAVVGYLWADIIKEKRNLLNLWVGLMYQRKPNNNLKDAFLHKKALRSYAFV